jgi:hypothetical protein
MAGAGDIVGAFGSEGVERSHLKPRRSVRTKRGSTFRMTWALASAASCFGDRAIRIDLERLREGLVDAGLGHSEGP